MDGRKCIVVATSLEGGLGALRERKILGGDLVATETTSVLGTGSARTWAVHERAEEPSDEGHLWITGEELRRGRPYGDADFRRRRLTSGYGTHSRPMPYRSRQLQS